MARRSRARGRRSRLTVYGVEQFQAAVLAMRAADKDLRRDINARVRETMGPEWTQGLASRLTHPTHRVILAGARIAPGNPPQLVAGNSRRRIGRALIPVQHWPAWEFGTTRIRPTRYERVSPKGKRHTVNRHVENHLPRRNEDGHFIYPTIKELLPRIAALWLQTIIRTYLDAAEGK